MNTWNSVTCGEEKTHPDLVKSIILLVTHHDIRLMDIEHLSKSVPSDPFAMSAGFHPFAGSPLTTFLFQGEHGKQAGAESDDDLDESDEDEDPPQLHIVKVAHHGGINRVRSMPQEPGIVGTWGDTGLVQVRHLKQS